MKGIIKKYHNIAYELSGLFSAQDDVLSVLVLGSLAQGTADKYSDIDLLVILKNSIPKPNQRKKYFYNCKNVKVIEVEKQNINWNNQWSPINDKIKYKDIEIDIGYNIKSWIDKIVDKVCKSGNVVIPESTFRPYTFIGLLKSSIILYDRNNYIKKVIKETNFFPEKLKKNILINNVPIFKESLEELTNYSKRKNIGNLAFLFHLNRALEAFSNVLFAINEEYDNASKRAENELIKLKKLPKHFEDRINKITKGPFDYEGKKQVVNTLKDMFQEIEKYL
ncbi:MAG: nucleotidyltransferase domain-containing protein [bacterium]|nr:nucleotidyltransferase domain-containing protein [bacterium]